MNSTKSEKNVRETCWDFYECPTAIKEKCPAYQQNVGKDCWFFWSAKGGCPMIVIGKGCTSCHWFKRNKEDVSLIT